MKDIAKLAMECLEIGDPTAISGQFMAHGFEIGYTRAIADVVEWLYQAEDECVCNCEESCKYCNAETIAMQIENKFLKGEK